MAEFQSAVSGAGSTSPLRTSVLFGIALAVLHGYLASTYIDHPPLYDEMYHMLAAESWSTSGELRILDGEYLRAPLFTKMVALNANICGPSLECARSMSVAASVLLVFLVTAFAGTVMSPVVGFVAGLLLALNPAALMMSQFVRFYSLHALTLFSFAVILFALTAHWRQLKKWQILALTSLAAILLLFANHLHVLTQVGLLAVMLGAATILTPGILGSLRRMKLWIAVFVVTTVFVLLSVGVFFVDFEGRFQALRSAPLWAQGLEDAWFYYHHMLRGWYPVLWPMMAILSVLSIAQWPRPSIYFLVAFSFSLFILSIAAMKVDRLILFALPFLFIPMAGGITAGLQLYIGFLKQRIEHLSGWHAGNPLIALSVNAIVIGSLMLFGFTQPIARDLPRIVSAPESARAFRGYGGVADWPAATGELRKAINDYPIVLSSSGVTAAYYLGDFSFELNSSVMRETDTGEEFGLDPRTGRQVISSLESIMKIVRECGATLVIVDGLHYRHEETLMALDAVVSPLTPAAHMRVWRLDPHAIDTSGVEFAPLEAGSLNCRPVIISGAR
jgi:hypothetical protein